MPADTTLTKKAHTTERFTEEQIAHLLACSDKQTGYLHFARHFYYIQHPTKGKMLFDPYEYQIELLNSYHNYTYSVNVLPRQSGKTTCAAGYLLWYVMFNPDQTILVAAHKFTGAQEIMQRIRFAYELCPDFLRAGVTSYNKGSIEFDNGSRIVSQTTTATTGRGMSISLLYCDEMSHIAPNIATAFWTSISPTLATGGKAIITSTPNSDEDQFAIIWKESQIKFDEFGNENKDGIGINGFYGYTAPWDAHPDRDEAWKEAQIGKIGLERFRREFQCLAEDTLVTVMDIHGNIFKMPIGELYDECCD